MKLVGDFCCDCLGKKNFFLGKTYKFCDILCNILQYMSLKKIYLNLFNLVYTFLLKIFLLVKWFAYIAEKLGEDYIRLITHHRLPHTKIKQGKNIFFFLIQNYLCIVRLFLKRFCTFPLVFMGNSILYTEIEK
jgi:hypothetical protein